MINLIGDEINAYEQWLDVPGATVHLYGKGAPRPGRKMGPCHAGDAAKGRLIGLTKKPGRADSSPCNPVSGGGHCRFCLIHPRAQG